MQIRIRSLFKAVFKTIQRATHAFAAPIENMGIDYVVILDSVPVGRLQRAGAPESLDLWLQKSESAMGNIYYRSQIYKKFLFQKIHSFEPRDSLYRLTPFKDTTKAT